MPPTATRQGHPWRKPKSWACRSRRGAGRHRYWHKGARTLLIANGNQQDARQEADRLGASRLRCGSMKSGSDLSSLPVPSEASPALSPGRPRAPGPFSSGSTHRSTPASVSPRQEVVFPLAPVALGIVTEAWSAPPVGPNRVAHRLTPTRGPGRGSRTRKRSSMARRERRSE